MPNSPLCLCLVLFPQVLEAGARQGTISEAQRQVLAAELAGRLEQWL